MHALKKNHGLVSNKNILFFQTEINSTPILTDGLNLVSQDLKDHTIAQLELMSALAELLLMLIIKHASLLELLFQEQTQK